MDKTKGTNFFTVDTLWLTHYPIIKSYWKLQTKSIHQIHIFTRMVLSISINIFYLIMICIFLKL